MRSMTGFAALSAGADGRRWRWEAKSVNGRGLDLRFRLAEGAESAEAAFRALASKKLARGNVTFVMRAEEGGEAGALRVNAAALNAAIAAARDAEWAAAEAGLTLAPSAAADLLALRGVLDVGGGGALSEGAAARALTESFSALLDELDQARESEGARLAEALGRQVGEIEALAARAVAAAEAQQASARERLSEKVAALTDVGAEVEPERLAQELALLAVKADVREELDRLAAHIAAARDLLQASGPVGRKLDFLTQEFNREVNTICSKSASAELTAIGLELKVVVDQMREQAQNVE